MRTRSSAGFALIDLLFVCGIIGVISAIAVPRLVMARQSAGAASAIGSLRSINSAQLTFALTCGGGFYAPDLPALGAPPIGAQTSFLSQTLTNAPTVTKSGYSITVQSTPQPGTPATCNGLGGGVTGSGFKAAADPLEADNTRYFATNSAGQLYEHSGSMLATMPEMGVSPAGHVLQ